jgi:hypothetical protein
MKTSQHYESFGPVSDCCHIRPPFSVRLARLGSYWAAVVCLVMGFQGVSAADFAVTYTGLSAYAFNGTGSNPTLTLIRGQTYTFAVSTPTGPFGHPFRITNAPAGSTTGNNTSTGTVTFTVPTNEVVNIGYDCSIHHFGGLILTIPPPTFRIVNLSVGQNLVVKSIGTNNWNLTPQYSTNLGGTNWFALTVQSNRFSNGTNETFCGRPPVSNAFIRISARRN